jgi:hypothetical protein
VPATPPPEEPARPDGRPARLADGSAIEVEYTFRIRLRLVR